jgi:hypothetical protein
MSFTSIRRRTGRGLTAVALVIAAVSLTSPGTAYARHGNGAGIALGILGGALAGAAIASATAPGYYGAPPTYYYPQIYSAPLAYYYTPTPAYYYAPAPTYYMPTPYYGPQYYYDRE